MASKVAATMDAATQTIPAFAGKDILAIFVIRHVCRQT